MDPAMLQAEYAKLDPEALKAHYLACKAAMFASMAPPADAGMPPEASAPAAPPAAPPAPEASAPMPPPAMKGEVSASGKAGFPESEGNGEHVVAKSEIKDLKLQVEGLTKALNLALGAPMRKSIKGLAYLPKSEIEAEPLNLTKAEAVAKLKKHSSNPKTDSATRKLINAFCNDTASLEQIKHLLS